MDKLGRTLREAREAEGTTLEEAEAATHIRAQFLESLEAGDYASFSGGDVQVRGFLRIYARYLDLSPEAIVGRYNAEVHGEEEPATPAAEAEVQTALSEPPNDLTSIRFRPRDIPVASSLPRWMSVKTIIILGIVLTLLLGILAVVSYLMNRPEQDSLLTPLATSAAIEIAEPPNTASPLAQSTPTFAVETGGEMTLARGATEHVQARMPLDDEVVFQRTMSLGQIHTRTYNEMTVVKTGNGAALPVTVNGAVAGLLREEGEFCSRAWMPVGEVSPA